MRVTSPNQFRPINNGLGFSGSQGGFLFAKRESFLAPRPEFQVSLEAIKNIFKSGLGKSPSSQNQAQDSVLNSQPARGRRSSSRMGFQPVKRGSRPSSKSSTPLLLQQTLMLKAAVEAGLAPKVSRNSVQKQNQPTFWGEKSGGHPPSQPETREMSDTSRASYRARGFTALKPFSSGLKTHRNQRAAKKLKKKKKNRKLVRRQKRTRISIEKEEQQEFILHQKITKRRVLTLLEKINQSRKDYHSKKMEEASGLTCLKITKMIKKSKKISCKGDVILGRIDSSMQGIETKIQASLMKEPCFFALHSEEDHN